MAKKLKIDTIDENFIINSFRQDEPVSPTVEKQAEVRKRISRERRKFRCRPNHPLKKPAAGNRKRRMGTIRSCFSKKLKYPPVSENGLCAKSLS